MPRKHTAFRPSSKISRVKEPTYGINFAPVFHTQVHKEHYTYLSHRRFGESRDTDWDTQEGWTEGEGVTTVA